MALKYFTFHFPEQVKLKFKVSKLNFKGVEEIRSVLYKICTRRKLENLKNTLMITTHSSNKFLENNLTESIKPGNPNKLKVYGFCEKQDVKG